MTAVVRGPLGPLPGRWDWKIRSYNAEGRFCRETVHRGTASRDMELRAIDSLGRTAEVWDLATGERWYPPL